MLDANADTRPGNDPATKNTRVLYIGGEGRSGSTVLSALLGGYDGVISVGEIRNLWLALKENELCGCGEPVGACAFWAAVGREAFGGWRRLSLDRLLAADAKFARHRNVPAHLLRRGRSASIELRSYRATLARTYRAIRDVSGASLIVDSTKRASYAYLLRDVPGVELRLVHLVRDSRGVAFSNAKSDVVRPEVTLDRDTACAYMSRQCVLRTALDWQLKNMLFYTLVSDEHRRLVKYEDFVNDPQPILEQTLKSSGMGTPAHESWDPATRSFEWRPQHTVGGNPVRFNRGRVQLRRDEEWKARMNAAQRLTVDAVTFPLLVAYGYRVRTGNAA